MTEFVVRPPARSLAALLVGAAAAGVVVYLFLPDGTHGTELAALSLVAASALIGAAVLLWTAGRPGAWVCARWLSLAVGLIGAIAAGHVAFEVTGHPGHGPGRFDAAFLLLLAPIVGAARAEYRAHFAAEDRREIAIDAGLIAASLAAICYVLIRPTGVMPWPVSVSAGALAVLAAVFFTLFGVLALWLPTAPHLSQWIVLATLAGATTAFGVEWTQKTFNGSAPEVVIPLMVTGPLLAAAAAFFPRASAAAPTVRHVRLARPILTSTSVAAACAAFITISTLNDARRIAGLQSTAIVAVLGIGVAARILANQLRSTQSQRKAHEALAERERALQEVAAALEQVREANETLRDSEERLRLVFEAAVDGIVELNERGVILRANEAFCGMVRLDRQSIEGIPWSALAASITGADDAFASLPSTGHGTIQRPEGQPLYLESRISDVPMIPPRRLLLVRDVTAGKVADQTIRSLFQFLQDRDEDRTRFLRRTNAAIESERNRIARDLHDGPVQGVSAASLSLEAALLMIKAGETDRGMEVLTKIRRELAEEADGLRRLMSGLRPPVLEERGLIPALRETLTRFEHEGALEVEFTGALSTELPDDLETLAYRVVQEALSNAAKHAEAERVLVSVESDQSQLRIEIVDDGRGFDPNHAREFLRMGRVGLASMRERVELASGTFVVRSTPGRGTTIVATLPVEPVGRELTASEA
jgi:signal transduction histidine kinase